VGQTSAALPIKLANTGGTPLNFGTYQGGLGGIDASGDFSETNNCGTTVAAGQSCTISVTFSPSQAGARSGDITVYDNISPGSQVVPLTGTGVGSVVTTSPNNLAFASQAVGTISSPQVVTVTNTGNSTLTISALGITGSGSADFVQTNNCGASLTNGASCQIMVTFTPQSQNTFTAAISISDSAPGSPQMVALSGSGSIVQVSFSPSSISFPSQYVGTSGLPQSVTLTNTGSSTLIITSVSASPADFGELSSCGSNVGPGASCSIGVFFDPTAAGPRSGALTITDNATGSPQSLPLTGMGQDFSLTPGSQTTATVTPGGSAGYTVSVAPGGGFSQTVALSCSGGPAGSTCSVSPDSLKLSGTSAATATVTVTTAASSAGLTQPYSWPPGKNLFEMWSVISGTLGLAVLMGTMPRRRAWHPQLLYGLTLFCLLSVGVTLSACGGGSSGSSGTQTGTYTLTVTGTYTSGSTTLTNSTKLTLVVQ